MWHQSWYPPAVPNPIHPTEVTIAPRPRVPANWQFPHGGKHDAKSARAKNQSIYGNRGTGGGQALQIAGRVSQRTAPVVRSRSFAVVRLDVWMQQRLILSLGITHKHGGQLASFGHLFKVRHPVQRFGNTRAERIKHLRLFAPHRHALRDIGKCVGYSERAIPQSISEREWPDRHAYGHCGGRWQLRERQLLSPRRRLHQRGYWDVDWNKDIRQWHFLWRAGNPWIHAGRTDDAASG